MTDNVILSVSEVSEIQILHYIQNDIKVCKAALAQNDKAEKQCYNNIGGGFVKLLGCVPVRIWAVLTMLIITVWTLCLILRHTRV